MSTENVDRVKGPIKRNKNSLDNNQLCLAHLFNSPRARVGRSICYVQGA